MLGIGRPLGAGARRSVALVAVTIAVAVGSSTLPVAVTSAQDPAAVRAAQEIQAARDRANAASQAMFDAESRLDTLEVEIVRLVPIESCLPPPTSPMQRTHRHISNRP